MDVWQYILMENIPMPSLYFTHKRRVFQRDGVWLAEAPFMDLKDGEKIEELDVRCRTIGDISCTGLTLSLADNLEDIVIEVAASRITERGDEPTINGRRRLWKIAKKRAIFNRKEEKHGQQSISGYESPEVYYRGKC